MKEFEDKSHLLIARSLSDMVDDVIWVWILNPTLEQKKIYKKMPESHVWKTLKAFHEFKKITLTIITIRDECDFESMLTQVQWVALLRKRQKWGHFAQNIK